MKKLQHQNSCADHPSEGGSPWRHSADHISHPPCLPHSVPALEGKILLLEERNKAILTFYEQKIIQLKHVLSKQNDTKQQLMS
jgi:hypothetical protein